jgi:deoxyribodipyrimidine photo-lyase
MEKTTIFWFRRDLRLEDNCGLYHALKGKGNVIPVFIFDTDILNRLASPGDVRVEFIYRQIVSLKSALEAYGSSLMVLYGQPLDIFTSLLRDYTIEALYFNHDYEPQAIARDKIIAGIFEERDIPVRSFKDQVIFEKNEILKPNGKPYTVFTPYMKKWKAKFNTKPSFQYSVDEYVSRFYKMNKQKIPSLDELGFSASDRDFPPGQFDEEIITHYDQNRDYPALEGTTRLGVHFRYGTLSIRQAVEKALQLNETWLNELIWREFYMMILWHFPYVVDQSFKVLYDEIEWRNDEKEFQAWCEGNTGYPIVDAGMRELNQTGYMHNRVRMIVASFLTKHLLIDWRWGESYFAEKLLDYELSSNNGGWQWAAGSGCDAAPYFRIFNPSRQTERFDPHLQYVKRWVPEFQHPEYKKPIVNHKFARERALRVYGKAVKKGNL